MKPQAKRRTEFVEGLVKVAGVLLIMGLLIPSLLTDSMRTDLARGFRLKFIEENLRAGPAGQKPIEFLDLVFRSFQLFVLQISADLPMRWQLNLARLLAPLVAAYTALQALGELFAGQVRSPPTPRTWSSSAWDAWAKAWWSTPPANGTPSGPSPNASSASP